MTRASALAALLSLAGAGAGPAFAGAPCVASVEVAPARGVVGEQILYVARLLRRTDVSQAAWIEAPSFPSFRAERLPGLMGQERVRHEGAFYLVYEERRAIFAAHPGRIEIPPALLECQIHAPAGRQGRSVSVRVPSASVEIEAVPEAGRPPGWNGVVGRGIEIKTAVEPTRVALGGTVRVAVVMRGEANLWDAAPPLLAGRGVAGAEVFPRPQRSDVEAGPRVRARRIFEFELVPREAGRLVVPAVSVPYFDPDARAYAVATAAEVSVEVAPASRETSDASGASDGGDGSAMPAGEAGSALSPGRVAAALLALGALALVAVLRARRRAARAAAQGEGIHPEATRRAVADGAGCTADVLRSALARRLGAAASGDLAAEALATRAIDAGDAAACDAARLLVALERARFAPAGAAEEPSVAQLEAALASLGVAPSGAT